MVKKVFQSLIGILQTLHKHLLKIPTPQFQSLIGILQTRSQIRFATASSAFQSLIGILQTPDISYWPESDTLVSIPYRYSTNVGLYYPILHRFISFNPLQVFYKLRNAGKSRNTFLWFQSLIGILQTILRSTPNELGFLFQSLIGILQTKRNH